jgi:hypothetical protein
MFLSVRINLACLTYIFIHNLCFEIKAFNVAGRESAGKSLGVDGER